MQESDEPIYRVGGLITLLRNQPIVSYTGEYDNTRQYIKGDIMDIAGVKYLCIQNAQNINVVNIAEHFVLLDHVSKLYFYLTNPIISLDNGSTTILNATGSSVFKSGSFDPTIDHPNYTFYIPYAGVYKFNIRCSISFTPTNPNDNYYSLKMFLNSSLRGPLIYNQVAVRQNNNNKLDRMIALIDSFENAELLALGFESNFIGDNLEITIIGSIIKFL